MDPNDVPGWKLTPGTLVQACSCLVQGGGLLAGQDLMDDRRCTSRASAKRQMSTPPEHNAESACAPEQAASVEHDAESESKADAPPAKLERKHTADEQKAAAVIQVGRQHV